MYFRPARTITVFLPARTVTLPWVTRVSRALARVLDEPARAADRRRAVATAGPERALAVAPQLARLRLLLGRARALGALRERLVEREVHDVAALADREHAVEQAARSRSGRRGASARAGRPRRACVSIVAPNGTSSSAVSATKRELPFSRTRTVPDGVTTTVFANSGTGSGGGGGGGGGGGWTAASGTAETAIWAPLCHTATPDVVRRRPRPAAARARVNGAVASVLRRSTSRRRRRWRTPRGSPPRPGASRRRAAARPGPVQVRSRSRRPRPRSHRRGEACRRRSAARTALPPRRRRAGTARAAPPASRG